MRTGVTLGVYMLDGVKSNISRNGTHAITALTSTLWIRGRRDTEVSRAFHGEGGLGVHKAVESEVILGPNLEVIPLLALA